MQTDHESGPRTQIFEDMILNYFIVSISFIYTNHTKWKSCHESYIDVDVEKLKLWGTVAEWPLTEPHVCEAVQSFQ